jgi:gliding motility-associated protein GldL
MHWYESYQGKRIVGAVYSIGAAVVIIGAMFKILHLEGAGVMLGVGMITEAVLFTIGVFDQPHPEFHWENVFPQLLGYGANPKLLEEKSKQARPTLVGAGVAGGPSIQNGMAAPVAAAPAPVAGAAVPSVNVAALKDEDMKALKDGLSNLAKTATQLSDLGKVAESGLKLSEKLATAGEAADSYAAKLASAGAATESYAAATTTLAQNYEQISADVKTAAEETKAYKAGVMEVGQKLASLTSVYELQLQAVNAQVEAQKSVAAATKEAAEAQAAFAAGAKQLQKQVTDLNGIYGNMLSALA